MWNMRLEIIDYGWPERFEQAVERLKECLKRKGMDEKARDALVIRPIDIARGGAETNSPCGRLFVYPPLS